MPDPIAPRSSLCSRSAHKAAGAIALLSLALVLTPAAAQMPIPFDESNIGVERAMTMRKHLQILSQALDGDPPMLYEGMFTAEALEAVPLEDLKVQLDLLFKSSGGFAPLGMRQIDDTHMKAWLRGNAGEMQDLHFDLIIEVEELFPFRVEDILFRPVQGNRPEFIATWDDLGRALDEEEFACAMSVMEVPLGGGPPIEIYSRRADERMSIGPASSLLLMAALVDRIRAGDAAWDHQLTISDDLKSFPGSAMSRLPFNEAVELGYVALRLMAVGDNTGFDHLLRYLGREELTRRMWAVLDEEPANAESMPPFLSTLDHFKLKCQLDQQLLERFANANPEQQWALLDEEVEPLKVILELFHAWQAPRMPDRVGWFSSANALAEVMADLWRARLEPQMARLGEIMDAPPRIPWDRRVWEEFWLELSGEPGAMTGVWAMRRRDGREFIVAIVVNSQLKGLQDAFTSDALLATIDLLEEQP